MGLIAWHVTHDGARYGNQGSSTYMSYMHTEQEALEDAASAMQVPVGELVALRVKTLGSDGQDTRRARGLDEV